MLWFKKKHYVTILFQSGQRTHIECTDYAINWKGDEITALTFTDEKPKTLFIKYSAIESIWENL